MKAGSADVTPLIMKIFLSSEYDSIEVLMPLYALTYCIVSEPASAPRKPIKTEQNEMITSAVIPSYCLQNDIIPKKNNNIKNTK